ncbi:MAG: hypothetical protein ACLS36_02195 [Streptococcus sp.]
MTAALVKADTSRLVAFSDEAFVALVASELAVVDSEVYLSTCEVLALTSLRSLASSSFTNGLTSC